MGGGGSVTAPCCGGDRDMCLSGVMMMVVVMSGVADVVKALRGVAAEWSSVPVSNSNLSFSSTLQPQSSWRLTNPATGTPFSCLHQGIANNMKKKACNINL